MRSEDINRVIVKPYKKDYYQIIDCIRFKIQKQFDKVKFTNNNKKDEKLLNLILNSVFFKYEDLNLMNKWDYDLFKNNRNMWVGTISIHHMKYATFTQHRLCFLKKKHKFKLY